AFVELASGDAMTWRDYEQRSWKMALAMSTAYERGDRVALQLADGPGVHATMLACEKAGVVAVGIGSRAGPREVEHLVERTGARALLTSEPPESVTGGVRSLGLDDLWFLNSTSGT